MVAEFTQNRCETANIGRTVGSMTIATENTEIRGEPFKKTGLNRFRINFKTKFERNRLLVAATQLGCTAQEAERISKKARLRSHETGEALAKLGASGQWVHIVISGQATARPADGEDMTVGVGGVVGELYAHKVRHFQLADVVCDEKTETISIPMTNYRGVYENCPTIKNIVDLARGRRELILKRKAEENFTKQWRQYQELKKYFT